MKGYKILSLLIGIFCFGTAFAASLTLHNNSPFQLTAIINAANGQFIAQVTIPPGEQKIWNRDLADMPQNPEDAAEPEANFSDPNVSLTPFMVIWKCPYGGYYSIATNVNTGSYVDANSAPGEHFCRPKEEKQQDGSSPPTNNQKKSKTN